MAIKDYVQKWLGINTVVKQSTQALVSNTFFQSNELDDFEAMLSYQDNTWVHAAVQIRSEAFAKTKFFLRDTVSGDRLDDHPFLDFFNDPSQHYTRFELMSFLSMHEDLTGDAYWKYDFMGGKVISIQPLLPNNVTIKLNDDGTVKTYQYIVDGRTFNFTEDEITHFRSVSPLELVEGIGDVFAAAFAVDNEKHSNIWNLEFFKNGARNGTILTHPDTIDPESSKRIIQAFNNKYAGSRNAFKTTLLTGGMTIGDGASNHTDMEFSMLQDNNRDKILATFRVPKQLIGAFDGGSLAEAKTAEFIFSKYVMVPKIERFVQKINKDMGKMFGFADQNLVLEFESPVPEDQVFEEKKLNDAVNKWMTVNERRSMEGLDDIAGGDEILNPISTAPIEDLAERDIGTATQVQSQIRSVDQKKNLKNRLQRQKNFDEVVEKYRVKFLLQHQGLEQQFIRKAQREFAQQRARIKKKLEAQKSYKTIKSLTDDIFDLQSEVETFVKEFSPIIMATTITNSNTVSNLFGLGVTLVATDAVVQRFVQGAALTFSLEVNKTTQRELRKTLSEGLAEGESIPELSTRVNKVYKKAVDTRSVTIARTETTKASNGGALIAYDESGVVEQKSWLTVTDGRERETHLVANGQVVDLKDTFNVGGEELRFPSDPRGSGGNTINCRCTVVPVVF